MKICTICKKKKPYKEFEKSKSCKDGYRGQCKECRNKKRNMKHKHICHECGKEFTTAKKQSKFCSSKCSGINREKKKKVICDECGKIYETIPSIYNKNNKNFCSMECKVNNSKRAKRGINNHNYKSVKVKCDYCGVELEVSYYEYFRLKHHFCNSYCFKKGYGEFYKGKRNPNWNHNLTIQERMIKRRYPEYYNWRENVFKRDDYTCQICGDSSGGNLNAHHIFSYDEYKDSRIAIDNGITLCTSCHKKFHDMYGYGKNNKKQFEEYKLHVNTVVNK